MNNKEIAEGIYDRGHYFPGTDPTVTRDQVVAEIAKALDRVVSGDYEIVDVFPEWRNGKKDSKSFDVV